jgi:hypothetical protein
MKQNDHDSNGLGSSQEDVSLIYCHHIEDLQRIICELLCKNERLRMALADVKAEKQFTSRT